jgi:hypothetical protein
MNNLTKWIFCGAVVGASYGIAEIIIERIFRNPDVPVWKTAVSDEMGGAGLRAESPVGGKRISEDNDVPVQSG